MAKEVSKKIPMRMQDPAQRIRNFEEVALGYTGEEAVDEARRCLMCKKSPCRAGCPVEIDIPRFISHVKEGNFVKALEIIKEKNNLPAICGRVCPQETQCERVCIMGKKGQPVAIGRLERFVADMPWDGPVRSHDSVDAKTAGLDTAASNSSSEDSGRKPLNNIKVAVIGSGPAGLTCAADLARMGYSVTIFESLHAAGGVLRYGIPEFRLPKAILDKELEYVKSLGVDVQVNYVVGKTGTLDELKQDGYAAFFIGTGAGLPSLLKIDGENLNGVYSANEFLTRVNLMRAYDFPDYDTPVTSGKSVAVIGGGNTAVDAARVARRLGAQEVHLVYRRGREEMPARAEEIEHAQEEGVRLKVLTSPVEIIGNSDGWVTELVCIRNELGEPDAGGRRRPVPVKGSEFSMAVDTVVVAVGQSPNPLLTSTILELKLAPDGSIIVNDECMASIPGVFAGGDIISGEGTVIAAMGDAKKAARAIDNYLKVKYARGISGNDTDKTWAGEAHILG
jgi:glutamate synthase (NADPH/NADH) small chain